MIFFGLFSKRCTIKTLKEFYEEVERLVAGLDKAGYREEAVKIDSIFRMAWTTSTELLSEIALIFKEVRKKFKGDLRKQIDNCHHFAIHHRRILGLK